MQEPAKDKLSQEATEKESLGSTQLVGGEMRDGNAPVSDPAVKTDDAGGFPFPEPDVQPG